MENTMVKLKYSVFFLAVVLLLNACAPKYFYHTTHLSNEVKINKSIAPDAQIETLIHPYKAQLDSTMNLVLAISDTILTKDRPSSSLGNFFCDAILKAAEKKVGHPIDLSIVNYGGIRLGMIAAGNITLGKIYELMPFDNQLVILNIRGDSLAKVLDYIASQGGWPVGGVRFTIKKNSAVNIFINDKAFDITQNYSLLVSDYIANGGDNLSMLKNIPQQKLDYLMRDALIDYLKDLNLQGQHLKANNEQRIKNVE